MLKIEYTAIRMSEDLDFKPSASEEEVEDFFKKLEAGVVLNPSLILADQVDLESGSDLTIGVRDKNRLVLELPDDTTCDYFPLVQFACGEYFLLLTDQMQVYQVEEDSLKPLSGHVDIVQATGCRISARRLVPENKVMVIFGKYMVSLVAKSCVPWRQSLLVIKHALSNNHVVLPGSKSATAVADGLSHF